jgi:hypothetical protein
LARNKGGQSIIKPYAFEFTFMSIDMRIFISLLLAFTVQGVCAKTPSEEWAELSPTEKYHYVVGYIDGQLARNDTIENIHSQGTGHVNIPGADDMSATISMMDTLYKNLKLQKVYWFKLMPQANTKLKNPNYDMGPWIRGLE